jgi:hypothetical protein
MKEDGSIYLFDAIDREEDYFADSLVKFWDINSDVAQDTLHNLGIDKEMMQTIMLSHYKRIDLALFICYFYSRNRIGIGRWRKWQVRFK